MTTFEEYGIYQIDNFLTIKECDEFIEFSKNKRDQFKKDGFDGEREWDIDGVKVKGYAMSRFFEDDKVRSTIERVIKDRFPDKLKRYKKKGSTYTYWGIGDRMSLVYYKNGKITKHKDKSYYKNCKRGLLTLLIYFNDDYEGGETVFYPENRTEPITVKPKKGMGCIFDMDLVHECNLVEGEKYALNLKLSYKCI